MQLTSYIRQNTSVTEFAKLLKKSRQQVHRYMRGENLTVDVIEEIQVASGGQVTPADFFTTSKEVA